MFSVPNSILLGTISTSINLDYDIVEICFICVEVPIILEDGSAARAAAAAAQLAEAVGGAEVGVHGEQRAAHGHQAARHQQVSRRAARTRLLGTLRPHFYIAAFKKIFETPPVSDDWSTCYLVHCKSVSLKQPGGEMARGGGVGGGQGQVPQNLRGIANLVHSHVLSSIASIAVVLSSIASIFMLRSSIAVVLSSIVTIIMVPNSRVQVNAPCLLCCGRCGCCCSCGWRWRCRCLHPQPGQEHAGWQQGGAGRGGGVGVGGGPVELVPVLLVVLVLCTGGGRGGGGHLHRSIVIRC